MICNYCGSRKCRGDEYHIHCRECGITEYYPTRPGRLEKPTPQPLYKRLTAYLLFRIYKLSIGITNALREPPRKPRFGYL
jgi:hypothetical protein